MLRDRKMPIDINEWDSGKVYSLEERIMSFLNKKENINYAFSVADIMKGLGYKVKDDAISLSHASDVKKALDNLIKERQVEKKEIKGLLGMVTYCRPVRSVHVC